ncbi:MAG TPA: UPF0175 family protein [Acidisarcina sp.]
MTVEIPDDLALKLTPDGQDPVRATLEAVAIEGYRSGALNASQTRRLLGFGTRYELDGFFKTHHVWEGAYTVEDLERDRQTIQMFGTDSSPEA